MSRSQKGGEETIGRILPYLDTSVATFRTAGIGAAQTVLAVNNPAASGRIVTLRRIIGMAAKASLGQRRIELFTAPALATLGTVLVQRLDRTTQGASSYVARGATAADLGAATPITNPAGAVRVWAYADLGTVAGHNPFHVDAIDQSIEPGECFFLVVDINDTDNSQCTAYITEKIGLG